jgi:hypothetical protein
LWAQALSIEEMVAALLKVDPDGITGQRAQDAKNEAESE